MSDFYQTGVVTTLHRHDQGGLERLEDELEEFTRQTPVGLVLPALFSEFEHPAMRRIVEELKGARYIRRIVLPLARASREQCEQARSFFEGFNTEAR